MKNSIFERLKEIRACEGLNQSEFAKSLGIGQSTLAMLEVGKREILDRHIKTVCSIYNINENWLRTGQGGMRVENDSSIMAELATEYRLDDIDKKIIEHYLNLDSEVRQILKKEVIALAKKITGTEEVASAVEIEKEKNDIDIDAEIESYRKELEDAKKIRTSSASPTRGETS